MKSLEAEAVRKSSGFYLYEKAVLATLFIILFSFYLEIPSFHVHQSGLKHSNKKLQGET